MKIYLGFGANLGNRELAIRTAVNALDGLVGRLEASSSLYETQPLGFKSRHLFLNAVAVYDGADLSPEEILAHTESVERQLGRKLKSVGGVYKDRVIDIDLLFVDDIVLHETTLQLPHPEIANRRFVLEPLCELAPTLRHPVTRLTVSEHLEQLNHLTIRELVSPTQRTVNFINALLRQLSPKEMPTVDFRYVKMMFSHRNTHIYIGYDETNAACAMASLCLAASPTGVKGWLEDVVVDETCRGRGYGRALIDFVKAESVRLGAKSLNLTSKPSRKAANKLYASAGMTRRRTNVYRWQQTDA